MTYETLLKSTFLCMSLTILAYLAYKYLKSMYKKYVTTDFPDIKSINSLTKKHLTLELWNKYKNHKTHKNNFTLLQCINTGLIEDLAVKCGCFAMDKHCYLDFNQFFDSLLVEYNNLQNVKELFHKSDLNVNNLKISFNKNIPIISTRMRVGRSLKGFRLPTGFSRNERLTVEKIMIKILDKLGKYSEYSGNYVSLLNMNEKTRKYLVSNHYLFNNGDEKFKAGGNLAKYWPEGRGIFMNKAKTFIVWLNEEDSIRIISMERGNNIKSVFNRLIKGIYIIENELKLINHSFDFSNKYGYYNSCPSNLGTGLRASIHVKLLGWKNKGVKSLVKRCNELGLQKRGPHGDSGIKIDNGIYDLSNKYRLGYSEVELVEMMIKGVNTIYDENLKLLNH